MIEQSSQRRPSGQAGMWPFLLLAGIMAAQPVLATEVLSPAAARGLSLAQRWCAGCHVIGDGRSGTDAAPTFRSIALDPQKGPDHLRAFLAQPHPPMPPVPLGRQEIDDLVAYIQSLAQRSLGR